MSYLLIILTFFINLKLTPIVKVYTKQSPCLLKNKKKYFALSCSYSTLLFNLTFCLVLVKRQKRKSEKNQNKKGICETLCDNLRFSCLLFKKSWNNSTWIEFWPKYMKKLSHQHNPQPHSTCSIDYRSGGGGGSSRHLPPVVPSRLFSFYARAARFSLLPSVFRLRTAETSGVCLHGRDVDVTALCINLVFVADGALWVVCAGRERVRCFYRLYSGQERRRQTTPVIILWLLCCFVCQADSAILLFTVSYGNRQIVLITHLKCNLPFQFN